MGGTWRQFAPNTYETAIRCDVMHNYAIKAEEALVRSHGMAANLETIDQIEVVLLPAGVLPPTVRRWNSIRNPSACGDLCAWR